MSLHNIHLTNIDSHSSAIVHGHFNLALRFVSFKIDVGISALETKNSILKETINKGIFSIKLQLSWPKGKVETEYRKSIFYVLWGKTLLTCILSLIGFPYS